jgi:hypothetical protein
MKGGLVMYKLNNINQQKPNNTVVPYIYGKMVHWPDLCLRDDYFYKLIINQR